MSSMVSIWSKPPLWPKPGCIGTRTRSRCAHAWWKGSHIEPSPRALCKYTNGVPSPACRITVGRPATVTVSGWPPLRDSSTRAPYFSFFRVSNIGQHLAGQQFHALAGQFVGQRPGLAAGQDHADPQLLAVLVEFLADRGRAADDGEDALL